MILFSLLMTILLIWLFVKIGFGLLKIFVFLCAAGIIFWFFTFLYLPLMAIVLAIAVIGLVAHLFMP